LDGHFPIFLEAVMQRNSGVALIAGVLLAIAAPVRAQTTIQRAADVLNRPPAPPAVKVEPVRKVEPPRTTTTIIIPRREVVVVERVHGRRYGWWKHPGYRVITVYYDGSRFYHRPFDRRVLRKIVVYERAGRYYIDENQWKRDRSRHYGQDNKWRDDERRRDDDRWKGNDDKWKDDDDKDRSRGDNGRYLGQDPDKHQD
jgi:hypothetical protein